MKKRPSGKYRDENARLRGDLLTIAHRINHDLRTPLGGVISSGEALKETLIENQLPVTLADSLLHSADEIARIIRRVSQITRASANPTRKEPVAMEEVVSGVLSQLESRALKIQAVITVPQSWPTIKAVSGWLEIIWWNLVANALQHAGESPEIELGWHAQIGNFCFWVCDNGPGVSESVRSKLFQPFDSLHELDGTRGLGLSIVERLVELQGGSCGYEAKPDGRSCVFFVLPTAD